MEPAWLAQSFTRLIVAMDVVIIVEIRRALVGTSGAPLPAPRYACAASHRFHHPFASGVGCAHLRGWCATAREPVTVHLPAVFSAGLATIRAA